ncbi:hypothetical protein RFI_37558 [Reticulomyxa filosa]|uniref:Uncharacterized protein n=1 Tax=Reticulomyxa filosa TaxID=46433 RepID=X6LEF2_RETFI|nr:hypothetical protein RFI_37558 [Reticulomyxa filosa]|eukprot:ETN99908.1 hypothetical protein RFI_37558 [Reticulomyxa filosa]
MFAIFKQVAFFLSVTMLCYYIRVKGFKIACVLYFLSIFGKTILKCKEEKTQKNKDRPQTKMKSSEIANVLCLAISLFVCAPWMGFFFWRYVLRKDRVFIRQRRFRLVITIQVFLFALTAVERPLAFLLRINGVDSFIGFVIIENILWSICYVGLMVMICWRYWIFYCDIDIYQSSVNRDWRDIINPLSARNPVNLFFFFCGGVYVYAYMYTIKKKKKCPNRLFEQIDKGMGVTSTGIMYILAMIVLLAIWFKIPNNQTYADVFFIRHELKYISVLAIIIFLISSFTFIVDKICHSLCQRFLLIFFLFFFIFFFLFYDLELEIINQSINPPPPPHHHHRHYYHNNS